MKQVICVGSGLAAIYFSLLIQEDCQVILIPGNGAQKSNSFLAKGGIAASWTSIDQEAHIQDTLVAGTGFCKEEIVREVIYNCPQIISSLKEMGLLFDPTPGREGGHSKARIEHISDQTGKYLVEFLWDLVLKRKNILILDNHFVMDLLVDNGTCKGVLVCNGNTGEAFFQEASATVLASGGCGNLYAQHTNGVGANGEGLGMVLKAGVKVLDMEFIQFHPTKLFTQNPDANILVTEAFRGAGAFLMDEAGNDFMKKIHPLGSLAPRDVVSIGMFQKMEAEGKEFLNLDFSKISPQLFQKDFPYLYEKVDKLGQLESQIVGVTPAAHYQCGGIAVNENAQSSMPGLFAIGELARTGLHGANRLASNSLLELFYFSGKLANRLNQTVNDERFDPIPKTPFHMPWATKWNKLEAVFKQTMWHSFGILRNGKQMQVGLNQLNEIEKYILQQDPQNFWVRRFANRILAAKEIALAAIKRPESMGCHHRID